MKREVAERLAATQVEGLTVGNAQKVISSFLREVARCPVCDGSGKHTFDRNIPVITSDNRGSTNLHSDRFIPAGAVTPCPWCATGNHDEAGHGDPDFVAWVCHDGFSRSQCEQTKQDSVADIPDAGSEPRHKRCGWSIVIPLP